MKLKPEQPYDSAEYAVEYEQDLMDLVMSYVINPISNLVWNAIEWINKRSDERINEIFEDSSDTKKNPNHTENITPKVEEMPSDVQEKLLPDDASLYKSNPTTESEPGWVTDLLGDEDSST